MQKSAIVQNMEAMLKGFEGIKTELLKGIQQPFSNNPEMMEKYKEALKNPALKEAAEKIIELNKKKRD